MLCKNLKILILHIFKLELSNFIYTAGLISVLDISLNNKPINTYINFYLSCFFTFSNRFFYKNFCQRALSTTQITYANNKEHIKDCTKFMPEFFIWKHKAVFAKNHKIINSI